MMTRLSIVNRAPLDRLGLKSRFSAEMAPQQVAGPVPEAAIAILQSTAPQSSVALVRLVKASMKVLDCLSPAVLTD